MKKVLGGLLVATAVVSLAACSGGEKKASSDVSIKDRYELDEKTPAWKLDKKKEPTKINGILTQIGRHCLLEKM